MERHTIGTSIWVGLTAMGFVCLASSRADAYERYNDGCQVCHGDFTGPTSTKGTVFPEDSKHEMHRNILYMGTNCALCHTPGDGDNPFTGSSQGTPEVTGYGCVGCHGRDYGGATGVSGVGLRAHHGANQVTICAICHPTDPAPLPENISPPYYGTGETNANDPCNAGPGFGENWSIGDTEGLDKDGDNDYDGLDSDCAVVGCPQSCGDIDGSGGGVEGWTLTILRNWPFASP